MKKILQVSCGNLNNGGVQNVIMGICRNLSYISFDILLFTDKEGYYDKEFLSLGGKIFRISHFEGKSKFRKRIDYYVRFPRIFIGTYNILKKNGPYDAIHCHNYFESGICTFAARLAGVKVRISHSHSARPIDKSKILWNFYNYILKKLIKINSTIKIGCSKQANSYLYDGDKEVFIINNAIDLYKFNRKKYSYSYHKSINFVNIGRFSAEKNQLFLLDVFKIIRERIPESKLILVGFGENEVKIKEKIGKLELDESVQVLPPNSDIPKLLSESDYLIFPSIFEGFGLVLLEAQTMGVKCFVSSTVPSESNMGLCISLDLKEGAKLWAQSIVNYILNDNRYEKKFVKEEVLKRYDIQEICRIYKKIYNGEKI